MAELDPGRLIEEAQELIARSRDLCKVSRHSKNRSRRLRGRVARNLAFARIRRARKRPPRLLKKSA